MDDCYIGEDSVVDQGDRAKNLSWQVASFRSIGLHEWYAKVSRRRWKNFSDGAALHRPAERAQSPAERLRLGTPTFPCV